MSYSFIKKAKLCKQAGWWDNVWDSVKDTTQGAFDLGKAVYSGAKDLGQGVWNTGKGVYQTITGPNLQDYNRQMDAANARITKMQQAWRAQNAKPTDPRQARQWQKRRRQAFRGFQKQRNTADNMIDQNIEGLGTLHKGLAPAAMMGQGTLETIPGANNLVNRFSFALANNLGDSQLDYRKANDYYNTNTYGMSPESIMALRTLGRIAGQGTIYAATGGLGRGLTRGIYGVGNKATGALIRQGWNPALAGGVGKALSAGIGLTAGTAIQQGGYLGQQVINNNMQEGTARDVARAALGLATATGRNAAIDATGMGFDRMHKHMDRYGNMVAAGPAASWRSGLVDKFVPRQTALGGVVNAGAQAAAAPITIPARFGMAGFINPYESTLNHDYLNRWSDVNMAGTYAYQQALKDKGFQDAQSDLSKYDALMNRWRAGDDSAYAELTRPDADGMTFNDRRYAAMHKVDQRRQQALEKMDAAKQQAVMADLSQQAKQKVYGSQLKQGLQDYTGNLPFAALPPAMILPYMAYQGYGGVKNMGEAKDKNKQLTQQTQQQLQQMDRLASSDHMLDYIKNNKPIMDYARDTYANILGGQLYNMADKGKLTQDYDFSKYKNISKLLSKLSDTMSYAQMQDWMDKIIPQGSRLSAKQLKNIAMAASAGGAPISPRVMQLLRRRLTNIGTEGFQDSMMAGDISEAFRYGMLANLQGM